MTTVGLCLPQLGGHVNAAVLQRFCERSEELGYAGLWVQEHLFHPTAPVSGYAGTPGAPVPEQYRSVLGATELMAAAAAWTESVMIGSSILVAGYHRPVELAQRLATIDLLSNGRLVAGFSVGWSDDEHLQMDVDPKTRGRRCDELVRALIACWGPDPVSFEGEFFHIPLSDVSPKPLQHPHPRLLSGMWSPAGIERTVAFFDIWNPARGSAEELRIRIDEMNANRPAGARPLELYVRTFAQRPSSRPGGPVQGIEGIEADVAAAREASVDHVIVDCNFWEAIDAPDRWADVPDLVAPALAAAGERR